MISLNEAEKKVIVALYERAGSRFLHKEERPIMEHLLGKIDINLKKYKDGKIVKRGKARR